MILIHEDLPERVSFENTRSGHQFAAWFDEDSNRWLVNRQHVGWPSEVVGAIECIDDVSWDGFAGAYDGNVSKINPVRFPSRDEALEWVTNDRSPDTASDFQP